MSIATVYSRAIVGMEARVVTVEVHLSNGLPSLSIVGNINPNLFSLINYSLNAYKFRRQ